MGTVAEAIEALAFRLYVDHMERHGAPATKATWDALDERARKTYRHSAKQLRAAHRRGDLAEFAR